MAKTPRDRISRKWSSNNPTTTVPFAIVLFCTYFMVHSADLVAPFLPLMLLAAREIKVEVGDFNAFNRVKALPGTARTSIPCLLIHTPCFLSSPAVFVFWRLWPCRCIAGSALCCQHLQARPSSRPWTLCAAVTIALTTSSLLWLG